MLIIKSLYYIEFGAIVFVVTNPPLIYGFIALISKIKVAKCIIRVDDISGGFCSCWFDQGK